MNIIQVALKNGLSDIYLPSKINIENIRGLNLPLKKFNNLKKEFFLELKEVDDVILIKLNKQDIPSKKISTYYGQIAIGENPENYFNVLFDTGSSEFWIPFETCNSSQCNIHKKYKKSKTFKYKYDKKGLPSILEINYLSGKIIGFDGYERIKLGKNLIIPNTNISFATNIDIPILEDFKWDGIIGLGFENEDSRNRGIKPFLDHLAHENILKEKNYKNQFGYYLSDKEGFITFGGIDKKLKKSPEENVIWAPVSTDMGFWTIDILGIRKEKIINWEEKKDDELIVKYEGFHDGGRKSIVDTGTFLIYAPKNTMENYLSDLKINSCDDKFKLPYIIFQIRSKEISKVNGLAVMELTLSPDDYVIEYVDEVNSTKECIIGIQADEQFEEDRINGWTLGQVFLKSYYTIFDKDNLQIGFVRSKKNFFNDNYLKKSFLSLRTKKKIKNYNGPL
ncbi:plasmepsin VII, putative [Plasmodium gallinaceum]|uniref:Plasmepsin VII, putative n=1 Tax=Plasmodium gallinaceum TaxID=5849 RepID=A0A1J1GXS2_PLAGA|nr:plasmepsin VII, putative [Plasmodium gallinaceum]CRG97354.1 plasmepsin VII, putative [Plasmodium gallinaceum]